MSAGKRICPSTRRSIDGHLLSLPTARAYRKRATRCGLGAPSMALFRFSARPRKDVILILQRRNVQRVVSCCRPATHQCCGSSQSECRNPPLPDRAPPPSFAPSFAPSTQRPGASGQAAQSASAIVLPQARRTPHRPNMISADRSTCRAAPPTESHIAMQPTTLPLMQPFHRVRHGFGDNASILLNM